MEKDVQKSFEKIERSIEELALMTARGFERIDKRFEQVDKRFEQVDKRFEQVDKRFEDLEARLTQKINGLRNWLDDLSFNCAKADDQYVIKTRVDALADRISDIENKYKR